jgi:vitamin B12 transporter
VAEALSATPAATVARAGSPGAQTSLFLRGGEADYVKVLVDGVAVNDPGGAVDLADLGTDQVERIEVVRGPVSVLYGSDAVAGVVQVFTRRGAGAPTLTAQLMGGRGQERLAAGSAAAASTAGPGTGSPSAGSPGAGSPSQPGIYPLWDAEATLTGSAGPVTYTVGGSRSWSDGLYPLNSDRHHTTGTARVAWTPGTTELAVSTRYSDSRSHFPTDGTGALVDENARLDRTLWTTSVTAGFRLLPHLDARLQAGLMQRHQVSNDPVDGPADTLGTYASRLAWDVTRRSVDARVDWEAPEWLVAGTPAAVISVGAAWEDAGAATAYRSESAFGPYEAAADFRRSTVGTYAQLLSEPLAGVHITLGGRLDDSDTYGAFGTGRLGVAVEPWAGTRLRAALGRGFKEPAFDQVFGSGFGDVGNPSLEPERSRSREVGLEQEITGGPAGALTLAATGFDQRFERLIQYTFTPPNPGDANYFNVGAARSRGLELEARVDAGRLEVTTSYTRLETEVLDPGLAGDAGFVEGEPLLRRPAHAGTFTVRYAADHGVLATTIHMVGEREDLDFAAGYPAPRVTLPAYATIDLSAEHALPLPGPSVTALVRVENVLDARYQSIAGFPGLGRVVRLGLRTRIR